jgi:carboxypeptidase Q
MKALPVLLMLASCVRVNAAKDEPVSLGAPELLRELSVDIGPRFVGTPGNLKAIAWAEDRMRAIGLTDIHQEPVTVPHWVRGAELGEVTAPMKEPLRLTALGGSISGDVEAEVLEVASMPALAALPDEQVRGKILFFTLSPERHITGRGYGQVAPLRRDGPSAAAKKGAVAMLMRSISTAAGGAPHTGSTARGPDTKRLPCAALSVEAAARLQALLKRGAVRVHVKLEMQELGMAQSANLLGEVKGSEHPEQVVLLGAHLDSWDITPGAIDDGSGVAIVLDAARHLIAEHPKRTVRVVLFTNEEFGLDGAAAYAHAHQAELDHHVIALELDSGAGRVLGFSYLAPPEADASMAAVAVAAGLPAAVKGEDSGADLRPLRKAGVPVLELTQDRLDYFDVHHSADDTFDRVDLAGLAQAAEKTRQIVLEIANGSVDLGRVPAAQR